MTTQILNGIAVEVSGEGTPLLCIHGLGGSSNTWTPVLPAFEDFKVIRFDLPGSGRSALGRTALSIELYVQAVEQVLEALGVDRVHIAAHSMGTIVAAHFAARHPQRVSSLALFGPLLAPPDAGRPGIQARADLAQSGGAAAMQEIADAIVKGATAQETKDSQPAVVALVRECIMRQSPEGYGQSCAALAEAQPAPVERITAPVLLVTGDQDGVAPVAAVRAFAERVTNGRMVTLAACGHWTTFEQPVQCVAELRQFYSSLA
ncbi:alpha/beta fold hydrolase [Pseudomonas oryzihabitans]|uniref:alpha/beta fold hydrolase n=1 Tax=Pseudomonas oryzihabitans TaxID=47885 RepID=UPI00123BC817|nr:alpha/beta fold hydrolase [Pseudomonas oryzihabitans]QEU01844.1 alpha/beta fold hydrolase [Pseudomonas oryzihabitans]